MAMKNSLPQKPRKQLSEKTKNLVVIMTVNSLVLAFLYFAVMATNIVVIPPFVITEYPITLSQIVYTVYWAAFAAFLVVFVVYNRAFTRKGITPEMLPDTMSAVEKAEYVNDGKRRLEKSRWMLSIIIPLLVTIALDAIYLFTWPMVQSLFNI